MMNVHRVRFLLAPVFVALLFSGCGDETALVPDAEPDTSSDSAPFLVGTGYPIAAALADSLVVVNPESFSNAKVAFAARYNAEGRWTPVPDPPSDFSSVALTASGDRITLAGAICKGNCEVSSVEFFDLGEGEDEWTKIGPTLQVDEPEPELSALPGAGTAVFSTPSGLYQVTEDRDVAAVPSSDSVPTGGSFICVSGHYLFQIQTVITNLDDGVIEGPIEQQVQEAQLLDLVERSGNWESVQSPPLSLTTVNSGGCTFDEVVFFSDGTETTFEVESRKWFAPVETRVDGSFESFGRTTAVSPDGDLYGILADSRSVVIRDRQGECLSTDQTADSLFRTSSMVLATSLGDRTVHQLDGR